MGQGWLLTKATLGQGWLLTYFNLYIFIYTYVYLSVLFTTRRIDCLKKNRDPPTFDGSAGGGNSIFLDTKITKIILLVIDPIKSHKMVGEHISMKLGFSWANSFVVLFTTPFFVGVQLN